MRLGRILGHRLRSLVRRSRADAELRREIEIHLEQLVKEHVANGMSEPEARLAALREFGPLEPTKERCRDMRGMNTIENLGKDLMYAFRVLRKSPGFTIAAVLSLGLGIGANTAIFGVVNLFLLRSMPFPQPDRLVALFERNVMGNERQMEVAPGNFLDWRRAAASFDRMSAYGGGAVILSGENPKIVPERLEICLCSGNIFSTLGVSPALGRSFLPEEDRDGAPRVVVISHNLWQRQFAGSPEIVGKQIRLDGESYDVIGVAPRGFFYPNRNVDAWIPLLSSLPRALQTRHDLHFLEAIGRLRPGVSLDQANAEIDGLAARYKKEHPSEATGRGAAVVSLHGELVRDVRPPLLVLMGAVFCLLLIACVNIANLFLARAMARSREIVVRAALGASRRRIVTQLVAESLLVSLAGGVVGAILAISIARVLAANAPGAAAVLPAGNVPLDPVVFLFAFALALVVGVAVGLFPAVRISRVNLVNDLKDGGRSATSSRAQGRFRATLVAAEVGLPLVLLVSAGLLLHSFARLFDVQPGVRVENVLTLKVSLPGASYRETSQRSALFQELGERLRTVPGVKNAGLVSCAPLAGTCNVLFFYIEGRPYVAGKFLAAMERSADPAYFAAAGIPLLRGRTFTRRDGVGFDAKHPRLGSVVISESMAKQHFPNTDPIGKRIFFDFEVQREKAEGVPAPRYEVIGVVGDVVPTLDQGSAPTLYRPLLDLGSGAATVLLHTAIDPGSVAASARTQIRALDPGLAVDQVQTMEETLDRSTADRRFSMLLFSAFATLAALLAAIGLYGIVSYAVSQRKAEIGIRMALGATGPDVRMLLLLQGIKPAVAGVVFGLAGAVFACRVLRSQLFGITPNDPLTFVLVPGLLLFVAAAACYAPAARATRLEATSALRSE